MKPEPLTKEKINEKVIWNRFWSIIKGLPIMKMKRKHDKEVIGLQVAFEGEILHIQRDVKSAVQWLLKEIEKKQEETLFIHKYGEGFYDALKFCKDLIKKAFEDVLRE